MKRRLTIMIAVALVATFAVVALAQQQGGGQFAAMREKYKYTFQLMTTARHINDLLKDKKYAPTSAQAKQLLGILKPLRTKPKLTQDGAKNVLKSLKKVFTAGQLNAMARMKSKFGQGRPPGARTGGPGGPGAAGGPGAQGQRPAGQNGQHKFDPNAMKDFNPFYTKIPKGDTRAAARLKMWNDFFAALEKLAKGK